MSASAKLRSMNVAVQKSMTHQEFFIWAQAQEGRYEFDGVRPVAMNGGSNNHGLISGNVYFQLRLGLEGSRCQPMPTEGGGIATTGNRIRYPEAVVTCSEISGLEHLVSEPVVVFEVLSPTSKTRDQITKLDEYHGVPTIRRYVILDQTRIAITVYWRMGDEPWNRLKLVEGDVLDLPEIDLQIPLAKIYAGIRFS